MPRQVMQRKAADNTYLHKDFHSALNTALDYVAKVYGADAVRDYLREFALRYYIPLKSDLVRRGLIALKEHYEKIYRLEGGQAMITFAGEELRIDVQMCPAVAHMRNKGHKVSPFFIETSRTVNAALCEDTPYEAELRNYDPETGGGIQIFRRRS